MELEKQKQIIFNVLKGHKPPGVANIYKVVRPDFSILYRVVMTDWDEIIAVQDNADNVWIIDKYDWFACEGVYLMDRYYTEAKNFDGYSKG